LYNTGWWLFHHREAAAAIEIDANSNVGAHPKTSDHSLFLHPSRHVGSSSAPSDTFSAMSLAQTPSRTTRAPALFGMGAQRTCAPAIQNPRSLRAVPWRPRPSARQTGAGEGKKPLGPCSALSGTMRLLRALECWSGVCWFFASSASPATARGDLEGGVVARNQRFCFFGYGSALFLPFSAKSYPSNQPTKTVVLLHRCWRRGSLSITSLAVIPKIREVNTNKTQNHKGCPNAPPHPPPPPTSD